ncbi:DNA-binding transcriptional MerR regulator [Desulfohalotomaculum tongense]|uniref:MerR family transcriptional regulator n=1 Tax=Desulforadius tongensis TaxID=1216062 RepID=UPI001956051C|nr:MerR family transcriptional regulator [Desulforadius tongensis]MBM7854737.1 DNA-binding transcriptional MerR regulator [Desulforadius tongensis]
MYTIGQFSKICKVTTRALRHYENIGLLVPAKVDENNQYRYYTSDQIPVVKNICFLKELGIPLKIIAEINDKITQPEEIRVILEEHRQYLIQQLDLYNSRLVKLARWQKSLEVKKMTETKHYDIRIRDIPEIFVRSLRKKIAIQKTGPVIRSVQEEIHSLGGVPAGPPILLFYDEEFNPDKTDLEIAWPVGNSSLAGKTLPAVLAATCIHVGPYDRLDEAYEAIFSWINRNGYREKYPTRQISLNDPRTTPAEKLVSEIIIPVEKQ